MVKAVLAMMAIGGAAVGAPSSARETQTVKVATESELQHAIGRLHSGTTILLAPGVYRLTRTLTINGAFSDVVLRGASGKRDDVVLRGGGMTTPTRDTPHGIWIGGNVRNMTIADLTVRDVYEHAIVFNPGTQKPTVSNVHLVDAGAQFVKSNPSPSGGVADGVVEKSLIEYTTTARSDYTNAVDVHTGTDWVIRDNVFRNILGPPGTLAGPAVLVWNRSVNTTTERNTFVNCARAISYGLIEREGGRDHRGGVIKNNVIFRSRTHPGDVGILVADSPDTKVLHNTVFLSGTYATPIEYRFSGSSNVVIVNNIVDGTIGRRDGATASERNTIERASATLFVDAIGGDLHLSPYATGAIDRGDRLSEVSDDFDGDRRPLGAGSDLGADEYRPSPVPVNDKGGKKAASRRSEGCVAKENVRNRDLTLAR
jgi:hypothetical protein